MSHPQEKREKRRTEGLVTEWSQRQFPLTAMAFPERKEANFISWEAEWHTDRMAWDETHLGYMYGKQNEVSMPVNKKSNGPWLTSRWWRDILRILQGDFRSPPLFFIIIIVYVTVSPYSVYCNMLRISNNLFGSYSLQLFSQILPRLIPISTPLLGFPSRPSF